MDGESLIFRTLSGWSRGEGVLSAGFARGRVDAASVTRREPGCRDHC
jgi:hypothetical protein